MDAAGPEAAEPQERAEPKAEPRKWSRWRIKVPTSVTVTLLGVALTAWLLPAFTRQWDDRQRAHELEVGLVSEIAAATADAVTTGETLQTQAGVTKSPRALAHRQWSTAALRLDGRLRAYFPDSTVVAAWQIYAYALGRFSGVSGGAVERVLEEFHAATVGRLADASGPAESAMTDVDPGSKARAFPQALWKDVADVVHALNTLATAPTERAHFSEEERQALEELVAILPSVYYPRIALNSVDIDKLEPTLLRLEQALTSAILAGHPAGYSTTTRDLIHDLLPF